MSQKRSSERDLMIAQLRRQSLWLEESWSWILRTKVLSEMEAKGKPTALDVGCGPGFVMERLSHLMEIKGVDIDSDTVSMAAARGLNVTWGKAEELPFEDGSFDIVYCSFLMLWLNDPKKALEEMKRVTRRWVICLAEPDYGGRIDYPNELAELRTILEKGIIEDGGDPHIGRKLRSLFQECGLHAEIGIHPGVWDIGKLEQESDSEWRWIKSSRKESNLMRLKEVWDSALQNGMLFQFNPIFYAIAQKR